MTPEQLQQYVEGAVKQRDQFAFVWCLFTIVLSLGSAWLFSYLREKGKNYATKEDIAALTKIQEEIKTELANRSHFSRSRYDTEMKFYREIWAELVNFYGESASVRQNRPVEEWNDIRHRVSKAVENNKPFYPKEVWDKLREFVSLCERYTQAQSSGGSLNQQERTQLGELLQQLNKQLCEVEETIRNRLSKFDVTD